MATMRICLVAAIAMGVSACTWVPLSQQGAEVQVFPPDEVANCERKGKVTVSVKHKIGAIQRSGEKVARELATLARNAAARMGGNVVSPDSEPKDGSQVFGVYVCPPPAS
ncbi:MAG: DUF4156 domain-containing protein [Gammaproteobacteria bacterium]